MLLKKKKHARFVVRNSLMGDGFSAQICVPKKINMKTGRDRLNFHRELIEIINGEMDETTSQPVFLVTLDKPDILIFYLGNWDLESNFPWDLS